MSRPIRGRTYERPAHVHPTGRTRRRYAATPVRPQVYYRPTPHGGWVTIVNGEALPADERADIAEAVDRTEAPGGHAEGDRLRVDVSPSLDADAVYIEDVGTPPTLVLRPYQSPERAVVAVTYCLPGMSPLEVKRLVDAHLAGFDGTPDRRSSAPAEPTSGTARTRPVRARMLVVGALAGAAALAASVMANASDGSYTTAPSKDADELHAAGPVGPELHPDAQTPASLTLRATATASESKPAESTPIHDALVQEMSGDEPAPASTSAEDDPPTDTSADSTTAPTTSSESPAPTEPSDLAPEQDEPEDPDGLLDTVIGFLG